MIAFGRRACLLGSLVLALSPAMPLAAEDVPEDPRTVVEMPPLQQHLLRQEMLSHTLALHRIIGHLANEELGEAAEVAEKELGLSTMGQHAARTAGQGPGRFMPAPMRSLGIGLHQAASAFADVAETGDLHAALARLNTVTMACVSCHAGYRLAR